MRLRLSAVDSFEIFLGLGVYADLLALLDENGDSDPETCLGRDELGCALNCIALDGLFGLCYEIDDLGRNLDVKDLIVVDGASVGLAVFKKRFSFRSYRNETLG